MSRLSWAVSGILSIGLVWTMLDNRRLRSTLSQLHRDQAAAAAAPEVDSIGLHGSVAPPAARPSTAAAADDEAPTPTPQPGRGSDDDEGIAAMVADRIDEAVEARIDAKRAERFENMLDRTTDSVDNFADEAELSDEDREAMHELIDAAMEELVAIWEEHQDEADREAARQSMHSDFFEVRDEMDAALVDLLGEEDAAAFQQRLRGPLGWQR